MKKICIIFLGKFAFDARCINMAEALLEKKNVRLSIISLSDEKKNITKFNGIKFYSLAISNIKIFKYYDFYKKAKKIVQKNSFDCIIASDLYSLASACQSKKNINIVYDCREIYSELEAHISKPLYRWFWKKYEKYYLSKVNNVMVTAPSDEFVLRKIHQLTDLKDKKHPNFHTIYNYPKKTVLIRNNLLRQKFQISEDCKIILYQGVIQKGRGIDKLIKLISREETFVAVIIGDGNAKKDYIRAVQKKQLIKKCFFMDAVPYGELFKYTASADIGWLLIDKKSKSNQLALPNKLFEYFIMGLPIITSDVNNMAEIVRKYQAGIVVNNENDVDEYSAAALSLANSHLPPDNIHDFANTEFSWDGNKNIKQKFLNIII